jgi:hypothetical protein
MQITPEQHERIQDCLPVRPGNVRHENLVLLNAILYVAGIGELKTGQARFGLITVRGCREHAFCTHNPERMGTRTRASLEFSRQGCPAIAGRPFCRRMA